MNDHDFRSDADGMFIPYGIYDTEANRASHSFQFGGANKAERSDALGAVVEVKPVPRQLGRQIQSGANQVTTSRGQGLIDGYDLSAPMPGRRSGWHVEVIG